MNLSFNYSGFIEMFLNTSDEFEPYGCVDTLPPGVKLQNRPPHPPQHYERLIEPGED